MLARRHGGRQAGGRRIRYACVMSRYCDFAPGHPLHGPYHDTEYGFPQRN